MGEHRLGAEVDACRDQCIPRRGGDLARGIRLCDFIAGEATAARSAIRASMVAWATVRSCSVSAENWASPARIWLLHLYQVATELTGGAFLAGLSGRIGLVGAACPLTVAEKWFLTQAGRSTYSGGFIDHYLVQPVYEPGITPLIAILIPAVWLIPTVAAYARSSTRSGAETSPSGS